jgi:hypothetical protein
VITSTLQQVLSAVISFAGTTFIVTSYDTRPVTTKLAVAQAQTWAFDESYSGPNGPFTWVQTLLNQRFDFARRRNKLGYQEENGNEGNWNFGYPGQRADQLLANPGAMGDVLGSSWDLLIGNAGANDLLQGASATTIRDRIVALWDAFDAAKKQYMWLEVPPSGTPSLQTISAAANALLRPLAAARGIPLLRWDPAFYSGGSVNSINMPDGTHPSDAMAWQQANYMCPLIDPFIQTTGPDYTHPTDGSWLTTNAKLAGQTSGDGKATGWILNTYPGATITPTKISGDIQRLSISQSTPGTYIEADFSVVASTSGWAVGDIIEGVFSLTCYPSGLDLKALQAAIYLTGVSTNPSATAMLSAFYDPARWTGNVKPFTGVLRTPPIVIPHGCTGISVTLQAFGAATIDVTAGGIRKSTQE